MLGGDQAMSKVLVSFVFLIAVFTVSMAVCADIDASHGGNGWTVASGNNLVVPVQLTNSPGDMGKHAMDLELLIAGGAGILPKIQDIDLLAAGAVFNMTGSDQNLTTEGAGSVNAFRGVRLSGSVTTFSDGLLANVLISTVGVTPGTYTLTPLADGPHGGCWLWTVDADAIPLTMKAGTITVTPEPSGLVLSGIAALAFWAFCCRRKAIRA
jgi:hypothetical protein